MQHERGHCHYCWLPQQTSITSLFIFYSSISTSFLQLSSLSAYPSSIRFTPLILDCLSFIRLKKLALESHSALIEEIWVQRSSVASWVPLSNRNIYNSSRLLTQCLWICQSCTGEFICIKFTENTQYGILMEIIFTQWLDIFALFTVF